MATHSIVSDCLSSASGKRSRAAHKNDTAHTVSSPQNTPPPLLKAISELLLLNVILFMKHYLEDLATLALFLHFP